MDGAGSRFVYVIMKNILKVLMKQTKVMSRNIL